MPTKKSERAIRIRGLAPATKLEEFTLAANRLNKVSHNSKKSLLTLSRSPPIIEPQCSLAPQDGGMTGTLSFASSEVKDKAVKKARDWEVDDLFDGLTVLCAPRLIDVEWVDFLSGEFAFHNLKLGLGLCLIC